MEQKYYQSNYYKDLNYKVCLPTDNTVLDLISLIVEVELGHPKEWFTNWHKYDLWYSIVAMKDNLPISIASARKDGKILCYLYTLPKYRNMYRELAQIDYIPIHVELAKTRILYLSIHAFDKKHERLAKAWDRKILNHLPNDVTPYRGKFVYKGIKEYRHVPQHIYELDLDNV
jgi:hypothetical protein